MGQTGVKFPDVQRRRQSRHIPEGTTAHESRQALIDVTRPKPGGRVFSGQPEMVSDASPELAKSIFAGLRPEMWSEEYRLGELAARSEMGRNDDLHVPPVPPDFTPFPFTASRDAAKLFREYAAINPEIKRTMKQISVGPDSNFIKQVFGNAGNDPRILGQYQGGKVGPDNPILPMTSTFGQTSQYESPLFGDFAAAEPYREMYIAPHGNKDEIAGTMGHELGHVLLGDDEEVNNRLEALLQRLSPPGGRGGRIPFSLRIEDIK